MSRLTAKEANERTKPRNEILKQKNKEILDSILLCIELQMEKGYFSYTTPSTFTKEDLASLKVFKIELEGLGYDVTIIKEPNGISIHKMLVSWENAK